MSIQVANKRLECYKSRAAGLIPVTRFLWQTKGVLYEKEHDAVSDYGGDTGDDNGSDGHSGRRHPKYGKADEAGGFISVLVFGSCLFLCTFDKKEA